jgi:hypothetical protein
MLLGHMPNGVRSGATLLTRAEFDTRLRDFLLKDCNQRNHVVDSRELPAKSKIDGLLCVQIEDVKVRK